MVETVAGVKYTNKYKDGSGLSDAAPVIRYAEVVLNIAEAYARKATPDLTKALTLRVLVLSSQNCMRKGSLDISRYSLKLWY